MGNSNEVVANYVSEEELNEYKLNEKIEKLRKIDGRFWNWNIDTKKALELYNHMMNNTTFYDVGSKYLKILRIRYLYSWYSNSKY